MSRNAVLLLLLVLTIACLPKLSDAWASSREELAAGRIRDLKDDNKGDNGRDDGDYDEDTRRGPSSSRHPFGSCREARLCCEGRDASCVVQKSKVNSILEDLGEDRTCYCDNACMAVGDCCPDYKAACGVQDCIASDWGQWTDCDVQCGLGTSSRSRRIVRQPRNGGQECPEVTQKRGCHGFNCEVSRAALKASRETALILASSFSSLRVQNASRDIRWNLKLAYPKDPVKESRHEYCVLFEVTKSRKGCEAGLVDNAIAQPLQVGSQVCVACQSAAWRKHLGYRCHGHGVDDKQTRWSSIAGNNCHGRWIRKGAFEDCPCHADGRPDFIFV